ncbi:Hypp8859 [Branchiostoma lanceolatum]|uniref:Hypp8859 protein n=1 Tax=Branchiostoma lanceolatum TaxID=7740 RepID=A0A8K0EG82_BRALA|nr:Hypp8859 [Branchiostoma lanceolatum]
MPTTTLPGGIKVYVAQSADKTDISPVYDDDSPRGDYPVVRGVVRGTSAGGTEKRKRADRVKTPKIRERSSRNLVSQPRTEDEGELRIAQRYRSCAEEFKSYHKELQASERNLKRLGADINERERSLNDTYENVQYGEKDIELLYDTLTSLEKNVSNNFHDEFKKITDESKELPPINGVFKPHPTIADIDERVYHDKFADDCKRVVETKGQYIEDSRRLMELKDKYIAAARHIAKKKELYMRDFHRVAEKKDRYIVETHRVSDEREKYIDHVKKLLQEAETCVQELTHKIDYYKFQADLLKDKNVEYYKRTHKAEMTLARISRERDEARDQLKKAKLEKDRFVSEDYRGRQVIHKMREDMARQKKERKALEHSNKALKDENRRCEERVNFAENEMSKMSEMIRQMGMESDKRVKRVQMEKESMEQEKKLVEMSKKRLQEKMERKVGEVHKIVRAREKEIDMLLVKIKAQANVITQLQGHLDSKKGGDGRAPTTPAEKGKKRIGQT